MEKRICAIGKGGICMEEIRSFLVEEERQRAQSHDESADKQIRSGEAPPAEEKSHGHLHQPLVYITSTGTAVPGAGNASEKVCVSTRGTLSLLMETLG